MKLLTLHEDFIRRSRVSTLPVRSPIVPRQDSLPVVAREKWVEAGDPPRLVKTFRFARRVDLRSFLDDFLDFEEKIGHHARIIVEEESVTLHLTTHGVNKVTELDKESAQFANAVFRDVVLRSRSSEDREE